MGKKRHCQGSGSTQVRMRWLFTIIIWIVTFLPSHFIHFFSFVYWTTSCLQQKTINCLTIVWHAQEISHRTAKHVFIYSFFFPIEFHLNLSPFQGSLSYFFFFTHHTTLDHFVNNGNSLDLFILPNHSKLKECEYTF